MAESKALKQPHLSIYLIIGLIGLFAVFTGFAKTFFIPLSQGTFVAPITIHIHGAFAFAWVILFVVQTFLIRGKNLRMHRSLGWLGVFFAVGIVITMVPAGMFQVERELKLGLGETAVSGLLGTVTSAIMFLLLVAAGFYYRRKPDTHKALMLLATIFVLWPAWFRFRHFFPSVPHPEIWFGLVLSEVFIIIALVVDWMQRKRVNKTLFYIGLFIIIETTTEVLIFDSAGWRVVAQNIYSLLQKTV